MKGHPHAKLAQEYWKEAETDDEAWRNWEYQSPGMPYKPCFEHPKFQKDFQYRRRPRTININGFEVPEPVSEPLEGGQEYWVGSIYSGRSNVLRWCNDSLDNRYLKSGLIHLTKEAAQLHIDALLSFTKR